MSFPDPPSPFLSVHISDLSCSPGICVLCAGYEGGKWRAEQLAEHAMEWLPEFCLSAEELEGLTPGTAVRLVKKAARLVYQTDKYKLRGEFGELFLHIILRQVFGSIPAISKIYWKDSIDNTVKGYDAVHVVEIDDELQLWLGEVKFYNNAARAIKDVVKEIEAHVEIPYMKNEALLIANKLNKKSKYYDSLSRLLGGNASLDEVFDVMCIPVLITYDSDALKCYKKVTEQYREELKKEVSSLWDRFEKELSALTLPVKVHLILMPLNTKEILLDVLNRNLKGLQ